MAGLITFAVVLLLLPKVQEREPRIKDIASYVTIGETKIEVEIMNTPELRSKGLSGKTSLEEDSGMLFIFEKEGVYPFWMKDMNFPIDILWIDENLQIIDITKNATPESYPQTFSPKKPIKYALEINTNFLNQHNMNIGDYISLNL